MSTKNGAILIKKKSRTISWIIRKFLRQDLLYVFKNPLSWGIFTKWHSIEKKMQYLVRVGVKIFWVAVRTWEWIYHLTGTTFWRPSFFFFTMSCHCLQDTIPEQRIPSCHGNACVGLVVRIVEEGAQARENQRDRVNSATQTTQYQFQSLKIRWSTNFN